MKIDDLVEGELRQAIACNICDTSEQVSSMVPPEWREAVRDVIRERPEAYWLVIRNWAFERGWMAFPTAEGTLDVCPRCMLVLRRMSRV